MIHINDAGSTAIKPSYVVAVAPVRHGDGCKHTWHIIDRNNAPVAGRRGAENSTTFVRSDHSSIGKIDINAVVRFQVGDDRRVVEAVASGYGKVNRAIRHGRLHLVHVITIHEVMWAGTKFPHDKSKVLHLPYSEIDRGHDSSGAFA